MGAPRQTSARLELIISRQHAESCVPLLPTVLAVALRPAVVFFTPIAEVCRLVAAEQAKLDFHNKVSANNHEARRKALRLVALERQAEAQSLAEKLATDAR